MYLILILRHTSIQHFNIKVVSMNHTPVLENQFVRLEPLDIKHGEALVKCIDAEMWRGMVAPPPLNVNLMIEYIIGMKSDSAKMPFAVVSRVTNEIVGSTSFYDYAPAQKRIELGSTFYSRNERSAGAIKKLGGVYEGTLRSHRIAGDGSIGDTMYFSMLKEEWPRKRKKLEERIALYLD